MRLRNENIGIVAGVAIVAIGMLLTGGNPGQVESAVLGLLMLTAVFGISTYLNDRDSKLGRGPERLPFRR
jgi:flagellar motor component MotA